MGKEYIPLFLDFNETTEALSDEECGRLIRAVVNYANGNEAADLVTSGEKVAFQFLKGLVDRNTAISEARARAGASKGSKNEQKGTNENKTEQNESKCVTNTKNRDRNQNQNQNKDEMFEKFWNAYPRKVAKPDAKKKFEKINPDEQMLQTMLTAIEKSKNSDQWRRDGGQYIPHPSTWLNQRRWEDEPPAVTSKPVVTAQAYTQRDYAGEQEEAMMRMIRGAIA